MFRSEECHCGIIVESVTATIKTANEEAFVAHAKSFSVGVVGEYNESDDHGD